ncbi:MFS transporter [Pueribacillus theae]|uniref:MFS transporter n=1 Tax=Pueribacillus theae TaxID=2171751 RepID=A0A2U1K5K9_9BACI|nr:MFS transporter [Pueribacillus theae]PWA12283.1 MFS transporter [Pueribacillus theae]
MMEKKVFFLLGFIMFLSMTGYGIVLPTLPFLAERLGLTSFQMGSLITGWALAQLITAPLWGRLADTWGRKPVLIFGLLGFTVAFFLLIFANSYWQLLVARMIGAALSSGTHPAVFSIVSDSTDRRNRNIAIAKMGALNGLGFLCGPAVGAFFTPFGVIAPFIVAGSLAFLTLPFAMKYLREPHEKNAIKRKKHALFRSFGMIAKKGYWQLYLVTFGVSMAASSFFGLFGYFMIERFQATPFFVSLAFSTQAGISVIVQFFLLERLYHLFKEEQIAKTGLLLITLGFGTIAFSPHLGITVLGCLFTGFGQACVNPTILSLLSKRAQYGQGVTMGMQSSMNSLGRIVGPLWGGAVFSIHIAAPFLGSAFITLLLFIMILLTVKEGFQVSVMKEESLKNIGEQKQQ